MNGIKYFKLSKSQEPLIITIREEMEYFRQNVNNSISSILKIIGETVFSALLTLSIQKYSQLFFQDISGVMGLIVIVLTYTFIFLFIFCFTHYFVKLVLFLKSKLIYKKKHIKEVDKLKEYIYKHLLNEITTAISLQQKAYELVYNKHNRKKNINLSMLYLHESIFYFDNAAKAILKKELVEISNPDNTVYTDFLNQVDPAFLYYLFNLCISSITKIKTQFNAFSQYDTSQRLNVLLQHYEVFIQNICEQVPDLYRPINRKKVVIRKKLTV